MNIEPFNVNNRVNDNKNLAPQIKPAQPEEKFLYSGTIQAFDSSLKLHKDIVGTYDAFSTFYINKNGSGVKVTAWGQRIYPAGTFSEVYKQAEEIYQNTKSRSYTQSDTESLLKAVEDKISSLNNKK